MSERLIFVDLNEEKKSMLSQIKRFLSEDKGAETLEYIAIAAIIITLGAAAYSTLAVSTAISTGTNAITSAIANPGA